jgi:hypothetical protein
MRIQPARLQPEPRAFIALGIPAGRRGNPRRVRDLCTGAPRRIRVEIRGPRGRSQSLQSNSSPSGRPYTLSGCMSAAAPHVGGGGSSYCLEFHVHAGPTVRAAIASGDSWRRAGCAGGLFNPPKGGTPNRLRHRRVPSRDFGQHSSAFTNGRAPLWGVATVFVWRSACGAGRMGSVRLRVRGVLCL